MSSPTQRDIFLCHASEDKTAIVNPIKDTCRELGVSTWLDDDEIKWGESITKRVQEGLSSSRFVIVVISESFVSKNWPETELNAAIHLEMASSSRNLLPGLEQAAD